MKVHITPKSMSWSASRFCDGSKFDTTDPQSSGQTCSGAGPQSVLLSASEFWLDMNVPWARHDWGMPFTGPIASPALQWSEATPPDCSVHSFDGLEVDGWSKLLGTQDELRTTIMLRNLPEGLTRGSLMRLLSSRGLGDRYNFAYLPMNFESMVGLTHAFVNFLTPADAQLAIAVLDGFSAWEVPSNSVCHVVWNEKLQGLDALVKRYRNSPVMHDSVPEEFKPIIIVCGKRRPFPPPKRKLKAPKELRTTP